MDETVFHYTLRSLGGQGEQLKAIRELSISSKRTVEDEKVRHFAASLLSQGFVGSKVEILGIKKEKVTYRTVAGGALIELEIGGPVTWQVVATKKEDSLSWHKAITLAYRELQEGQAAHIPLISIFWRYMIAPVAALFVGYFSRVRLTEKWQQNIDKERVQEWQQHLRAENIEDAYFFFEKAKGWLEKEEPEAAKQIDQAVKNGKALQAGLGRWEEWSVAWEAGIPLSWVFQEGEALVLLSVARRASDRAAVVHIESFSEEGFFQATDAFRFEKRESREAFLRQLLLGRGKTPAELMTKKAKEQLAVLEADVTVAALKKESPSVRYQALRERFLAHPLHQGGSVTKVKGVKSRWHAVQHLITHADHFITPLVKRQIRTTLSQLMIKELFKEIQHVEAHLTEGEKREWGRFLQGEEERLAKQLKKHRVEEGVKEERLAQWAAEGLQSLQAPLVLHLLPKTTSCALQEASAASAVAMPQPLVIRYAPIEATLSRVQTLNQAIDQLLDVADYHQALELSQLVIDRLEVPQTSLGFWHHLSLEEVRGWQEAVHLLTRYQWEAALHLQSSCPTPDQLLGLFKTRAILVKLRRVEHQRVREALAEQGKMVHREVETPLLETLQHHLQEGAITAQEAVLFLFDDYTTDFEQFKELLTMHPFLRLPLASQRHTLEALLLFAREDLEGGTGRLPIRLDAEIDAPLHPNGAFWFLGNDRQYLTQQKALWDIAHPRAKPLPFRDFVQGKEPRLPCAMVYLTEHVAKTQCLTWPTFSLHIGVRGGSGMNNYRAGKTFMAFCQEAEREGGTAQEIAERVPKIAFRHRQQRLNQMGRLVWTEGVYAGTEAGALYVQDRHDPKKELVYLPFGLGLPQDLGARAKLVHSDRQFAPLVGLKELGWVENAMGTEDEVYFNPQRLFTKLPHGDETLPLRDLPLRSELDVIRSAQEQEGEEADKEERLGALDIASVPRDGSPPQLMSDAGIQEGLHLMRQRSDLLLDPQVKKRLELLFLRPLVEKKEQRELQWLLEAAENALKEQQWEESAFLFHMGALIEREINFQGRLFEIALTAQNEAAHAFLPRWFVVAAGQEAVETLSAEKVALFVRAKNLIENISSAQILPMSVMAAKEWFERALPLRLASDEGARRQAIEALLGLSVRWELQPGDPLKVNFLQGRIDLSKGMIWLEASAEEEPPIGVQRTHLPEAVRFSSEYQFWFGAKELEAAVFKLPDRPTVKRYQCVYEGVPIRFDLDELTGRVTYSKYVECEWKNRWLRFSPVTLSERDHYWQDAFCHYGLWSDDQSRELFFFPSKQLRLQQSAVPLFRVYLDEGKVERIEAQGQQLALLSAPFGAPLFDQTALYLVDGAQQLCRIVLPKEQLTFERRGSKWVVSSSFERSFLCTEEESEKLSRETVERSLLLSEQLKESFVSSVIRLVHQNEYGIWEERWVISLPSIEANFELTITEEGELHALKALPFLALALLAQKEHQLPLALFCLEQVKGLSIEEKEEELFDALCKQFLQLPVYSQQTAALYIKGQLAFWQVRQQKLNLLEYRPQEWQEYLFQVQELVRVYRLYQEKPELTPLLSLEEKAQIASKAAQIMEEETLRSTPQIQPLALKVALVSSSEQPEDFSSLITFAFMHRKKKEALSLERLQEAKPIDPWIFLKSFVSTWNLVVERRARKEERSPCPFLALFMPFERFPPVDDPQLALRLERIQENAEYGRRLLLTVWRTGDCCDKELRVDEKALLKATRRLPSRFVSGSLKKKGREGFKQHLKYPFVGFWERMAEQQFRQVDEKTKEALQQALEPLSSDWSAIVSTYRPLVTEEIGRQQETVYVTPQRVALEGELPTITTLKMPLIAVQEKALSTLERNFVSMLLEKFPAEERGKRVSLEEAMELFSVRQFSLLGMRRERELETEIALLQRAGPRRVGDFRTTPCDLGALKALDAIDLSGEVRREQFDPLIAQWRKEAHSEEQRHLLTGMETIAPSLVTRLMPLQEQVVSKEQLTALIKALYEQRNLLKADLRGLLPASGIEEEQWQSLLERYQRGLLTEQEAEEEPRLTAFLLTATALQQLRAAHSFLEALEQEGLAPLARDELLRKLQQALLGAKAFRRYFQEGSDLLRDPKLTRKYLVFEYRQKFICRPGQIALVEKVHQDPQKWYQLRMGEGKTTIMPLIARELSEQGWFPILVVPAFQVARNRREFDLATFTTDRSSAYRLPRQLTAGTSSVELAEIYLALLKARQKGGYLVTEVEELAGIEHTLAELHLLISNRVEGFQKHAEQMEESEKNQESLEIGLMMRQLHWVKRIRALLTDEKSLRFFDEVDSVARVNKEINRAIGTATNPDVTLQGVAAFLFEILWQPGSSLYYALTSGTQDLLRNEEVVFEMIQEKLQRHEKEIREMTGMPEEISTEKLFAYLAGQKGLETYTGAEWQKKLGTLKEYVCEVLPHVLQMRVGNDFGVTQGDGITVAPRFFRNELPDTRFSQEHALVAYHFLAYGQLAYCLDEQGKAKEFWQKLLYKIAAVDPEFYRDIRRMTGRGQLLQQILDPVSGVSIRLKVLRRHVFLAGLVKRYPLQFYLPVQRLLFGVATGGMTGTLSRYPLPAPGGRDEEVLQPPIREIEGETLLRIASTMPDGFNTPFNVYGKEEEVLSRLIGDLSCKAILNGAAVGMSEESSAERLIRHYRTKQARPFLFLKGENQGVNRVLWIWMPEKNDPEPWQRGILPEETCVIYGPADLVGVDIPIPPGDVHYFPAPKNSMEAFCQGAWRARGLGERHRFHLHLSVPFAEAVGGERQFRDYIHWVQETSNRQIEPLHLKAQMQRETAWVKEEGDEILFEVDPAMDQLDYWSLENCEQVETAMHQLLVRWKILEPLFVRQQQVDFASTFGLKQKEPTIQILQGVFAQEQQRAAQFMAAFSEGGQEEDAQRWMALQERLGQAGQVFEETIEAHQRYLPKETKRGAESAGMVEVVQEQQQQQVRRPKRQIIAAHQEEKRVNTFQVWTREALQLLFAGKEEVKAGLFSLTNTFEPVLDGSLYFSKEMMKIYRERDSLSGLNGLLLVGWQAGRFEAALISRSDYDFCLYPAWQREEDRKSMDALPVIEALEEESAAGVEAGEAPVETPEIICTAFILVGGKWQSTFPFNGSEGVLDKVKRAEVLSRFMLGVEGFDQETDVPILVQWLSELLPEDYQAWHQWFEKRTSESFMHQMEQWRRGL